MGRPGRPRGRYEDEFSYRLRAIVHKDRRTMKDIAAHAKINPIYVCRWKNRGSEVPKTFQQLAALARALGVTTDYLLNGGAEMTSWRLKKPISQLMEEIPQLKELLKEHMEEVPPAQSFNTRLRYTVPVLTDMEFRTLAECLNYFAESHDDEEARALHTYIDSEVGVSLVPKEISDGF